MANKQIGIYIKKYLGDGKGAPVSVLPRESVGLNNDGTTEIQKLFKARVFDYPKSTRLLKYLLNIVTKNDSLILDFFAGSATTAQAVMELNLEDNGHRKYILCTLDEPVNKKSEAFKLNYKTIDSISRERIKKAKLLCESRNPLESINRDFGFKAFKVDTSNYKEILNLPGNITQESLFYNISNIKENRNHLDLIYQVMLTWGMDLSLKIVNEEFNGVNIYNVDNNSLIACFDDNITEETIREIAGKEPLRAVFKDSSFDRSASKINLLQIFKEISPLTKVKVI